MTAYVSHTTVDAVNAYELSEWWKTALGYADIEGDPNQAGDEECMIADPVSGHRILFVEVADPAREVTTRVHFDLRSRDGDRDSEAERLLALGAVMVADRRGIRGPGSGWVTMQDPEGHVFDVVNG